MTQAEFLTWFGQWKDVITTVVALAAIVVVVVQIRQAGRFEKSRIRREQVAARATLPLTLNTLSEYGRDLLEALAPLERWLEKGESGDPPTFDGPRMPVEALPAVEKVIAAYPDDDVAKALAAILNEVQVLEARSRDFSGYALHSWSISMNDNVVMAAGVVARCENLFDFARKDVAYGEPRRSHVQQVLGRARIREELYPGVWEATRRSLDDPEPTWLQRRLTKKMKRMFRSH